MSPSANCIEVSDVRVVFANGHEALKSISLTVPAGQFACIIGRSGAGKSTLLRTLNGLVQPTSGTIVVDGTTVTGVSSRARQKLQTRIGFIFQEFNLVERLSVL